MKYVEYEGVLQEDAVELILNESYNTRMRNRRKSKILRSVHEL